MTGAWDLLHVGHIRALQKARALGDSLVVGVMTDEFIRRSKKKKPIIPFEQRIEMVRALGCVDHAIQVSGHMDFYPLDVFQPSIRAVGPDYGSLKGHQLALEEMEMRGIQVVMVPKTPDISTTAIVERIENGQGDHSCCGMEGSGKTGRDAHAPGSVPPAGGRYVSRKPPISTATLPRVRDTLNRG